MIIPYNKINKEELYNEIQKKVINSINDLKLKIQKKKTDIFEFE
jgi:hypothetical protein